MTKFDYKSSLPQRSAKENLLYFLLPEGIILLDNLNVYHNFDRPSRQIHKFSFPSHICSISYGNITSESNAINAAYISGIIADFTEDEKLLPTISGRMSSEDFSFKIRMLLIMNGYLYVFQIHK